MFISKLIVKDFRAFSGKDREYKFDLSKRLTCISGHNGVGKSTILAILGNCGELKHKDGHHLNGTPFRGEYSQIIRGDERSDHSGDKAVIYFNELPPIQDESGDKYVSPISYRATFQRGIRKKEKYIQVAGSKFFEKVVVDEQYSRYRLIPKRSNERKSEKKINWPVYYLGLSRLFPVGESEESNDLALKDDILNSIKEDHKKILSSNETYIGASSINISDTNKKTGFGIETGSYSCESNSSGQDNIGQILLTILSFENLKSKLGNKYYGGLLLIDEIEATLHPAAQKKLLDYLYKKAVNLNLQIIFTSHSITVIDHMIKKNREIQSLQDKNNVIYLTSRNNSIDIKLNPDFIYITNNLAETYSGSYPNHKITIFTEDSNARWFLNMLFTKFNYPFLIRLNILDTHISWTEIIKLIRYDYSTFKNHIIIFDPDVNEQVNSDLRRTPYKINSPDGNVFVLPGGDYIEKIFWDYIHGLEADAPFFRDETVESNGITKYILEQDGPFSCLYKNYEKEEKKIKQWFESNRDVCELVFEYWIRDTDNGIQCEEFVNNIKSASSLIFRRL